MNHPIGIGKSGAIVFPSDIEVRRVERLSGVAAELAVRGWLEIVEKGWSDGVLNMSSSLGAFIGYAPNGRDLVPVGILTWQVEGARIWIYQAWVLPDFRGRGVYTAMWHALLEHAVKETKVASIEYGTHPRNAPMRAVAARLGHTESAVTLRYDILRD